MTLLELKSLQASKAFWTKLPTKTIRGFGVEIVDSIPDLIERVDAVLLETNDGRPHLEQILPVLKAGKPVFIDKPIAGSLADAIAIFDALCWYCNTPGHTQRTCYKLREDQAANARLTHFFEKQKELIQNQNSSEFENESAY